MPVMLWKTEMREGAGNSSLGFSEREDFGHSFQIIYQSSVKFLVDIC